MVFIPSGVKADDTQPSAPTYIVRRGDTLSTISIAFGVPMTEIIQANAISNPNLLGEGDELIIPGLVGVEGVLVGQTVPLGETYTSFARRYRVQPALINRINRVTSPGELYVGAELIVPRRQPAETRILAGSDQTLLELAAVYDTSPWVVADLNHLAGSWDIYPTDIFYLLQESEGAQSAHLIPGIAALEMEPLPLVQGRTTVIKVDAENEVILGGSLNGHDLTFFPLEGNTQVALQGIHTMADPGITTFRLNSTFANGETYSLEQMVILREGNYGRDAPMTVKEKYVDPAVTEPENELVFGITAPVAAERYWSDTFTPPSPYSDCVTSPFGGRRSFNNSDWIYFHSGIDFCGGTGVEIYAAAPGRVVYAGELVVRGNATILSHGWGVYTGYWHQSEILVSKGDMVEAGQVIGLVGNTGRSTGAHLHWEVWAGGVQVNPIDWMTRLYP